MPDCSSFLEAAEVVLADFHEPQTAEIITDEALRRGLIHPRGKTPVATMTASLYVEARDNPASRILRLGEPGPTRARRNSVRWTLREPTQ
jgi:hypothetical protein